MTHCLFSWHTPASDPLVISNAFVVIDVAIKTNAGARENIYFLNTNCAATG